MIYLEDLHEDTVVYGTAVGCSLAGVGEIIRGKVKDYDGGPGQTGDQFLKKTEIHFLYIVHFGFIEIVTTQSRRYVEMVSMSHGDECD